MIITSGPSMLLPRPPAPDCLRISCCCSAPWPTSEYRAAPTPTAVTAADPVASRKCDGSTAPPERGAGISVRSQGLRLPLTMSYDGRLPRLLGVLPPPGKGPGSPTDPRDPGGCRLWCDRSSDNLRAMAAALPASPATAAAAAAAGPWLPWLLLLPMSPGPPLSA